MYYNQDYGIMDLNYLVGYFQQVLGGKYHVELNSIEYPVREGITAVSLQAERVPFAINNVKSETLKVI